MYNQIFIESKFYPTSYLSEFDLNFLKSKDLITITGQIFQSNFVGEVITPEMSFFSVPKNFGTDEETINITKKALETFRKLDKKSKTLILNDEFTTSSSGELQSEKFYYDKLKEYFLDYITYEFIYPEKPIKIHSSTPIKGKIDVLSTIRNRDRTGSGITYKVKNLKNDPEWNLDDIYYSTIKYLTDKWATQEEKDKIHRMFLFLKEKEYDIKEIDISDNQEIITKINKCSVSGIHNPIKTTLLNYFKSLSVTKKFKLNIVYTKLFQNVWERIIQISLYHNQDFENSLISNFTNVETHSRWVSSSELENLLKTNPGYRISDYSKNFFEWDEKSLRPDVFSEFKRGDKFIRFIGDAKYYNDINSTYSKEMNEYNNAMDNIFPMCIFVPSDITSVKKVVRSGIREIIIFRLDIKEVLEDAINILTGKKSEKSIRNVHTLINKYTSDGRRNIQSGFSKNY